MPVELTGQSPFPPVGELPYLLTLPAYGFYWFLLADEEEAPAWHTPYTPDAARFPDADDARRHDRRPRWPTGRRQDFERQTLREYLPAAALVRGQGATGSTA